MKKGIILIIHLLATLFSFAQQKYTISGTIKDKSTGETLIGATIVLVGKGGSVVLSNNYGFYSITAPENNYTLVASFSGYITDSIPINLHEDIVKMINMEPGGKALSEVVVMAKGSDNITQTFPGIQKVSMNEIKDVPVLFGEKDVFKTLQLLPGVKSVGDGNSGFYVRGGASDQNLVLLDEAPVYNGSAIK